MKIDGRFRFPLHLKADTILEEAAYQEAVDRQSREEGKLTLPVTFKGIMVGYADLYRDGSFTTDIDANKLGEDLRRQFLDGTANCISVGPNPRGPILPFEKKDQN